MTLPRVGVLHRVGGAASLTEIFQAARGLCEPVLLIRRTAAAESQQLVETARQIFPVHLVADDEVVSTCREAGLAGLTTFHDDDLDVVDAAALELGLPGVGTVPNPWDKMVQRDRLPPWCSVPALPVDSLDTFRDAVASLGIPSVLKRRRSAGGQEIAILEDRAAVERQFRHRRDWRGRMLERYISHGAHPSGLPHLADFVSVETLSFGAERTHCAVFDKSPVFVYPDPDTNGSDAVFVRGDWTPTRLDDGCLGEVLQAVGASLDALDVRDRVTHTEVKLLASGPVVLEINGRVGGYLARLLLLTGGNDLIQAALTLALGRRPPPPPGPATGAAMGYYPPFPIRREVVRSQVTRSQLRGLSGVVSVSQAAVAGQPQSVSGYRLANLTLYAQTLAELDRRFHGAQSAIAQLYAEDLRP